MDGDRVITFDNEKSISEKVKFAIENGLAGIMVWSLDTDDFQGDCVDETQSEGPINFPLLRIINKAIGTTLDRMKQDGTNIIPHGKQESQIGAVNAVYSNKIKFLVPLVCIVEVLCMYF